ncbi:putative mitochondrial protein AtMg00310 [Silene latifolia]|uniref:putative mitochondrial protein AtMg00310 n=1 Tax=Silene latifolia TaxID=37657 RepID=UPI003D76C84A
MSRFWWGHEEGNRGISWVSWKKLCQPKGMGGMGFRDFKLFNLALLGKQAWRLTTETESLWARVMKARYYPNGDFLSSNISNHPSYTWRRIHEAKEVLDLRLRRRIGNGLTTRVWGDAWVVPNQLGRVISPQPPGFEGMMVAGLLNDGGGAWNEQLIDNIFLEFEGTRIKNIRLSENAIDDDWFWSAERDGVFSVKSAYRLLVGGFDSLEVGGASNWEREKWLWPRLWKIPVWPRVKLLF